MNESPTTPPKKMFTLITPEDPKETTQKTQKNKELTFNLRANDRVGEGMFRSGGFVNKAVTVTATELKPPYSS